MLPLLPPESGLIRRSHHLNTSYARPMRTPTSPHWCHGTSPRTPYGQHIPHRDTPSSRTLCRWLGSSCSMNLYCSVYAVLLNVSTIRCLARSYPTYPREACVSFSNTRTSLILGCWSQNTPHSHVSINLTTYFILQTYHTSLSHTAIFVNEYNCWDST